MSSKINVEDLQVGMYIHLDLGWMAHPFPLSSFRITSMQQIITIRQLGIRQLRWSPERSEGAPDGVDSGLDAATPGAEAAVPDAAHPAPVATARRDQAAEALRRQKDATRACERQFAEACTDLKRTMARIDAEPAQAGRDAGVLTQALLSKMVGDEDLCVRVLVEGAGDRASVHAMNVTVLALMMGRMFQLPQADLLDLGTGALLHDIGKLDLPERVRHIDDGATAAEISFYRDHVAHGIARGKRMNLSPTALMVIGQHHERADGSGFPHGLTLDRMGAAPRIVSLVNLYDNLCNASNPARSLTPHEALSRMFALARNKFDSTMLSGFIRMMGIYPPGSLVQLTDDRYAMVVSVNSTRPLKPTVVVCDPKVKPEHALHLDLERTPDLGIRRSLRIQALPTEARDYLQPRERIAYYFDKVSADQAVAESAA